MPEEDIPIGVANVWGFEPWERTDETASLQFGKVSLGLTFFEAQLARKHLHRGIAVTICAGISGEAAIGEFRASRDSRSAHKSIGNEDSCE